MNRVATTTLTFDGQTAVFAYQYDTMGRQTQSALTINNIADRIVDTQYDYLGRAVSVRQHGGTNSAIDDIMAELDYNSNGLLTSVNRLQWDDTDEVYDLIAKSQYLYNANNQLTSITHKDAADLTQRELYAWDYRNRLTTVTKQTCNAETETWTTVQFVEYAYDYYNVLIRKLLDAKTIFLPEYSQTVVQLDWSSEDVGGTSALPAVTQRYLWTPQTQDKLLADATPTETLWSLTDPLGTIREINANITVHLIYDAFGNLISGSNPILFGFTGKYFDVDTPLQNNVNRWYDATTGRWVSSIPSALREMIQTCIGTGGMGVFFHWIQLDLKRQKQ